MDSVKYISHKFADDVNHIKTLALYFDHIDIIGQSYMHVLDDSDAPVQEQVDETGKRRYFKAHPVLTTSDFTTKEFEVNLKPLQNEGLITYTVDYGESIFVPSKFRDSKALPTMPMKRSGPIEFTPPKNEEAGIYYVNNEIINDIIKNNQKLLEEANEEIKYLKDRLAKQQDYVRFALNKHNVKRLAMSDSLETIMKNRRPPLFDVFRYIGKLTTSFIDNFQAGHNTITTSKYLHEILKLSGQQVEFKAVQEKIRNEFNINPYFVFEAIKLAVPDLSKFPTEEVLEFRNRSVDELAAFKTKISELTLDLLNNYEWEFIFRNAQSMAEAKISPLIKDISFKLSDTKSSVLKSIIQEVRDPKSYSPLLLTLSNSVSNTLAMLVSLGFISLNTALEYYSQRRKITQDGIYYLFKAKKYFG